jgi:hypothetical protein
MAIRIEATAANCHLRASLKAPLDQSLCRCSCRNRLAGPVARTGLFYAPDPTDPEPIISVPGDCPGYVPGHPWDSPKTPGTPGKVPLIKRGKKPQDPTPLCAINCTFPSRARTSVPKSLKLAAFELKRGEARTGMAQCVHLGPLARW